MIGYPAVSVVANAILRRKTFKNSDEASEMLTLLKRTATRGELASYISRLTFIPSNLVEQSVSKALEISSSDDCIARVANLISNDETLSDELREAAMEIKAHFQTFSSLRAAQRFFSTSSQRKFRNRLILWIHRHITQKRTHFIIP